MHAHLLDELSALVVRELVLSGTAPMVLTMRSGELAPDAVTTLWKDGYLDRLEVQLSTDWKVWRAEVKRVVEAKDYKPPRGGPVDVDRLKADFAKEVKQQAEQRKGPGGMLIDVRLRNVDTGKNSEAVRIQAAFKEIGRNAGILVRVRVEDANGKLVPPEGPPPRRPASAPILADQPWKRHPPQPPHR
ncbi:hypothetical protein ACPZ19_22235 [Amycolatopsis lurida]